MCSNQKVNISISYLTEVNNLWKGLKFSIVGIKRENITENQILDFFTTEKYEQLNDLSLYVIDSIVKIIGPYSFKSNCSPQDEVTFEFTIFEDIGQVFLDQYSLKSHSYRNSPSMIPSPNQKLSFNQVFNYGEEDVTKTSIASPSENKAFFSSSNVNLNSQNSCKTIESKTQTTRFTRALSQQVSNRQKQNTLERINKTNPSSKELISQFNCTNNVLQINTQHLNDSINSDNSISFKNASKTPIKTSKPILKYSNINTLFVTNQISRKKQSITLNQDILPELTRNPSMYIDNFKYSDDTTESPYQKSRISLFGKHCPAIRTTSKSTGNSTDNNIYKDYSDSQISQNKIEESVQEESFTPSVKSHQSEYSFNSPQINPLPQIFQKQQKSESNNIQQKVIVEINSLLSESSMYSSTITNEKSLGIFLNNTKSIKSELDNSQIDEQSKSIDERNTYERSRNTSSYNKIITQNFKCFTKQNDHNIASHTPSNNNSTVLSIYHHNDQDSFL